MMNVEAVKGLIREHGAKAFVRKLGKMLEEKTLLPEQVSIRGLFEAMVGPVSLLEGAHQVGNRLRFDYETRSEGITSSMFPVAVGALVSAKMIEGYNLAAYIGDELVTHMPSNLKVDVIPGMQAGDGPLEVPEGEAYPDSSRSEKFVTISAAKRGRIITITKEAVLFDRVGMILMQARNIGEYMRQDKERRILRGVSDADSNVYKPQNSAVALYSAGNNNLITTNALVNWLNVDAALKKAALQTDEKGNPILVNPTILLVPRALWATASYITNATQIQVESHVAAPGVNQSTFAPAPYKGMLRPLTSPIMDALSTTTWFVGDFKRQFCYKEVWPLTVLAAPETANDSFYRDILYAFKASEFGDVGAIDFRYCYKNTA